jgi:hypothetical protein
MRSHETLIDLVFMRQPDQDDTSREAGVLRDIIEAHYNLAGANSDFGIKVIEIIEEAYVFAELSTEGETA